MYSGPPGTFHRAIKNPHKIKSKKRKEIIYRNVVTTRQKQATPQPNWPSSILHLSFVVIVENQPKIRPNPSTMRVESIQLYKKALDYCLFPANRLHGLLFICYPVSSFYPCGDDTMSTDNEIRIKKVPGTANLYCSNTGVLARYQKTNKAWKYYNPKDHYQIAWDQGNTLRTYHWLVAKTWVPPYDGKRVIAADGDITNTHPHNLIWTDRRKCQRGPKRESAESRYRGEYLQLAPPLDRFWVKSDGEIGRLLQDGRMKPMKNFLNGSGGVWWARMSGRNVPVATVVLDILGTVPRPSLQHRALPLDGNPLNTHPDNLIWVFCPKSRPVEIFRAADPIAQPQDPSIQTQFQLVRERILALQDDLRAGGCVQLYANPMVWADPVGRIVVIDAKSGLMRHVQNPKWMPNYRAKLPNVPNHVTVPDFIADAFAGTRHAPKLHKRGIDQITVPRDGDYGNLHPSNLEYKSTGRKRAGFVFVENSQQNQAPTSDT